MGIAVRVTREDFTAADLRAASAKCTDGAQVRRILALALVLDGRSRTEAAGLNGMDRQTLSDWVHRFNAEGIEGLKSRKSPDRAPFLTAEQKAELRDLVIKGPDPAVHKVVRWRCADLRAEVARRWSGEVHESTIGAWLGELRLTRLQPRPVHPKKDPAAEATFKKPSWRGDPPVGIETVRVMVVAEGSGRQVFGDVEPVKKPGPWAAACLRVVTPSRRSRLGN